MEWKEVTLGEIGTIVGGATPSTKNTSFYDGNIPWLTPKDLSVNGNKYIFRGERNITEAGFKSCSCKMLPKGSVLFSSRAPIGYVAIAANDMCTNQGFKSVIPNEETDSEFLYYLLKYNKDNIASQGSGTTFAEVSGKTMKDIEVVVPKEKEDQRRIASILSSLDRKIELNNKINADLEEMAQAIFKNWFVDFEPFKDGKFVDSELGMIPEGWKVGTLEDIAEITMGQSPAGNSLNENGEGMIFYQGSSDFGFRFPSIRVFTTEPKRLAVANSVLFSVRAPVGDINVAKEECCIGRGVASIKSKYGHDSYLFYAMKSLHKLFDSFDGEGTVFGSINKKTLSAIQILLPSDGIVEQFNNVASSFDDRIRSLSDENSRLSLLRDTLLPRLMSGELEVPE